MSTNHDLFIPCARCGAAAGQPCRTPKGAQAKRPHAVRVPWWVKQERASATSYQLSEKRRGAIAVRDHAFGVDPANMEVYEPGERGILGETGSWAIIRRQPPPLEGRVDQHFRPGRVFFLERIEGTDAQGFAPDGSYKALCRSPWGTVCLWPYEYATMSTERLVRFWADGALIFHPTDLEPARLDAVVFYARSRGIGLADAAVMALGSIEAPIGWFAPAPELAPDLEAFAARLGRSLSQHIAEMGR